MQLLVIVLVVLGVVALLAVWRRFAGGGSRSAEHAIERHEHALGVLGDVSRRADPPPSVRIVPTAESAKIHIRPTEEGASPVPRPSGEEVPPPRIRLEPPVVPGHPLDAPLAFGTPVQGTPAVHPDEPAAAWESRPPPATAGPDEDLDDDPAAPDASREDGLAKAERAARTKRQPPRRTAGTGAAGGAGRRPGSKQERVARQRVAAGLALVALAAVVFAAVQLAGGGGTPARSAGTTSSTRPRSGSGSHRGGSTTTTTTTAPTTTTPATISPLTTSASDVSYRTPSASYTLAFQTTGPCWVGIQQVAGGPWVWEETVEAGQQATYSASGAVIVRLGAPTLVKIAVNGITVQLPTNVQPYDLSFSPSA